MNLVNKHSFYSEKKQNDITIYSINNMKCIILDVEEQSYVLLENKEHQQQIDDLFEKIDNEVWDVMNLEQKEFDKYISEL